MLDAPCATAGVAGRMGNAAACRASRFAKQRQGRRCIQSRRQESKTAFRRGRARVGAWRTGRESPQAAGGPTTFVPAPACRLPNSFVKIVETAGPANCERVAIGGSAEADHPFQNTPRFPGCPSIRSRGGRRSASDRYHLEESFMSRIIGVGWAAVLTVGLMAADLAAQEARSDRLRGGHRRCAGGRRAAAASAVPRLQRGDPRAPRRSTACSPSTRRATTSTPRFRPTSSTSRCSCR